jgi:hypothetical protein
MGRKVANNISNIRVSELNEKVSSFQQDNSIISMDTLNIM